MNRASKFKGTFDHTRLYSLREWRRASRAFLDNHPECWLCGNVASVTDHKQPHKGNLQLFWEVTNWQPLCIQCHNAKSAKE